MRVFAALQIPGSVLAEIETWLIPLKRRFPRLRWVKPGQIHLTVRFLGDVGQEEMKTMDRLLSGKKFGRINFLLDRTGTFIGRKGRLPSIYWLGGDWSRNVFDIARCLNSVPDERGQSDSKKHFNPHLTIARQGSYNDTAVFQAPGPWQGSIDRIVVFNSTLSRSGPEYREICSYNLGD